MALTSKSLRNAVFACHAQSREFNQIVARSATANILRAGAAIRGSVAGQRRGAYPRSWHSRAGGGAVHIINSRHARRKLLCAGRVISSAPRLSTAPELSNWAYPRSRSGIASGRTAFSRKPESSRLAFRIPEFGQRGNGESRRAARTRH